VDNWRAWHKVPKSLHRCHKGNRGLRWGATHKAQGAGDTRDSTGRGGAIVIDDHLLHTQAGANSRLCLRMNHRRSDSSTQRQHKPQQG
jgi:hypothetical protein